MAAVAVVSAASASAAGVVRREERLALPPLLGGPAAEQAPAARLRAPLHLALALLPPVDPRREGDQSARVGARPRVLLLERGAAGRGRGAGRAAAEEEEGEQRQQWGGTPGRSAGRESLPFCSSSPFYLALFGVSLCLWALFWGLNLAADAHLRSLRRKKKTRKATTAAAAATAAATAGKGGDIKKEGGLEEEDRGYRLPTSPLFSLVACPNYGAECAEWACFAAASFFASRAAAAASPARTAITWGVPVSMQRVMHWAAGDDAGTAVQGTIGGAGIPQPKRSGPVAPRKKDEKVPAPTKGESTACGGTGELGMCAAEARSLHRFPLPPQLLLC